MPDMKEGDDGFWHHPKGDDTLPIVFSLKAGSNEITTLQYRNRSHDLCLGTGLVERD
jgi:hypothetical protein